MAELDDDVDGRAVAQAADALEARLTVGAHRLCDLFNTALRKCVITHTLVLNGGFPLIVLKRSGTVAIEGVYGLLLALKTTGLFVLTACAEIIGCYLPYLWLKHGKSPWLLIPAALSLAAFAWLLTLHPQAAGRIYAAYGGVYVATALVWLWFVERQQPDRWDLVGVGITLVGMAVIAFMPRAAQP